jgi:hypothetical protein
MPTTTFDTVYGPNLELEFEAVAHDVTTHKVLGYTGGQLTSINLYTDNILTTQIFNKTLSYTGSKLVSTVLTRISDSATLTKNFNYAGNDLISITAS